MPLYASTEIWRRSFGTRNSSKQVPTVVAGFHHDGSKHCKGREPTSLPQVYFSWINQNSSATCTPLRVFGMPIKTISERHKKSYIHSNSVLRTKQREPTCSAYIVVLFDAFLTAIEILVSTLRGTYLFHWSEVSSQQRHIRGLQGSAR